MRTLSVALTTLSLAVAAAGPAAAAPTRTTTATASTAVCSMVAGSISVGGYHVWSPITATSPPRVGTSKLLPYTYPREQARLSTTFAIWPQASGGTARFGWVVFGDNLYAHHYWLTPEGAKDPNRPAKYTKVGPGWTRFTSIEVSSFYRGKTLARQTAYALRNDGTLMRWSISSAGKWSPTGSAAGFSGVRSIALISRTATYDTFIANLRGGGLYTPTPYAGWSVASIQVYWYCSRPAAIQAEVLVLQ